MRKKLKPSIAALIISAIVNTAGFLANLISYFATKNLLIYIPYSGGEWSGQAGFGLFLNHLYPMTSSAQQQGSEKIWIRFDPVSLLITLVIVFVAAYIILKICSIKKKG